MRWFGESWGAPVCDPAMRMATPVGASCLFCPRAISAGDSGFCLPSASLIAKKVAVSVGSWNPVYAAHKDCMLRNILGPTEVP